MTKVDFKQFKTLFILAADCTGQSDCLEYQGFDSLVSKAQQWFGGWNKLRLTKEQRLELHAIYKQKKLALLSQAISKFYRPSDAPFPLNYVLPFAKGLSLERLNFLYTVTMDVELESKQIKSMKGFSKKVYFRVRDLLEPQTI